MSLPVVIPAAGLGSRLGALTAGRPKELLSLGGEPLLHGAILELDAAGVTDAVVVTSPGKPGIAAFLAERAPWVRVVEQPAPTGVFDAVERGRAALGCDRFVVLFPDFVHLPDQGALRQLLAAAADLVRDCSAYCVVERAPGRMGPTAAVQLEGGRITRVGPCADRGQHTAFAELRGTEHTRRIGAGDGSILDLLAGLAADGLLGGVPIRGEVLDVGIPAGHADAVARFADGRARWRPRGRSVPNRP